VLPAPTKVILGMLDMDSTNRQMIWPNHTSGMIPVTGIVLTVTD